MGIEDKLFDTTVDPRDHKVAKYMMKSVGRDFYNKAKKIKSGMVYLSRLPGRAARKYINGYTDETDALITGVTNMIPAAGLLLVDLNNILPTADTGVVLLCIGKVFGYVLAGMAPPIVSSNAISYLQSKHREAIEAVHGTPTA